MTQHSKLVDGLTNETISPATANLQREIRAILEQIKESDNGAHYNYEVQKITLGGDSLGKGENLPCKDVLLTTAGTDVQLTIVDSADSDTDGDAQGFLLPVSNASGVLSLKVDNVGRLRFYGTAAAVIYILVRE